MPMRITVFFLLTTAESGKVDAVQSTLKSVACQRTRLIIHARHRRGVKIQILRKYFSSRLAKQSRVFGFRRRLGNINGALQPAWFTDVLRCGQVYFQPQLYEYIIARICGIELLLSDLGRVGGSRPASCNISSNLQCYYLSSHRT